MSGRDTRIHTNTQNRQNNQNKNNKNISGSTKKSETINTSKIEIPQEYILLMRWFKWIDFDAINTNSLETSNQYEATRDWLTTEMHNWFGLDYYPVEEIITSNQIGFWFEFDRSFDKRSLMDMQPDKQYEIKKRYNGYNEKHQG